MGGMHDGLQRRAVASALAQYGLATWQGEPCEIAYAALVAHCESDGTVGSTIASESERLGLSEDTLRRLLTDVLRPIIADSAAGRQRRLGVVARGRGVAGAMEAVRAYVCRAAELARGRVDTCRIVAWREAAAPGAAATVPPEGGTDVSKAVEI